MFKKQIIVLTKDGLKKGNVRDLEKTSECYGEILTNFLRLLNSFSQLSNEYFSGDTRRLKGLALPRYPRLHGLRRTDPFVR